MWSLCSLQGSHMMYIRRYYFQSAAWLQHVGKSHKLKLAEIKIDSVLFGYRLCWKIDSVLFGYRLHWKTDSVLFGYRLHSKIYTAHSFTVWEAGWSQVSERVFAAFVSTVLYCLHHSVLCCAYGVLLTWGALLCPWYTVYITLHC